MRKFALLGLAAVVAALMAACTPPAEEPAGEPKTGEPAGETSQAPAPAVASEGAPEFDAKGSDGANHTLASLTADGPVYLYFIKDGCPVNDPNLKHYAAIAEALNDKAKIVGVANMDEARFAAWNGEHNVPFVTLYDPEKTIIGAYGAERSPWVIRVDSDGKIGQSWEGVSAGDLSALEDALVADNGAEDPNLSFPGAPDRTTGG